MACDECRELNSHTFRTADDLVHALRLAGVKPALPGYGRLFAG